MIEGDIFSNYDFVVRRMVAIETKLGLFLKALRNRTGSISQDEIEPLLKTFDLETF